MRMIRDIHSTIEFCAARLIWLALLVASICLLSTSSSLAQNNAVLVLENHKEYSISQNVYVTPDPNRNLDAETLIERYDGNLRGTKIHSNVIKMSSARDPIWIIFTVYNKTSAQDWVLDFGDSLSGRMGMIKSIEVINYTTKDSIVFPEEESNSDNLFIGSALTLDIKPDTKNVFIIRLEAQEGFPLIFNPKLTPQKNYLRQLTQGNFGHVFAAIMFIGVGVFFIAAYYIRRNKTSLALASYYIILCALFFNLSSSVVSHGLITGPVLFMLYMASFLLLIVATRSFCYLNHHESPLENIAIIAISGLIFIGTLLYLSVMGTSVAGLLIMAALVGTCMLVSLAVLFFMNDRSIVNTLLFGLGTFLPTLALIMLAFINADMIEVSSRSVASFWYIHMVQGIIFIIAFLHTEMHQSERDRHEDAERLRDEQSLARLQKSKESADQARLIRVIEREREIMAELREREVRRTEEMRIAKESADRANKAKSAFLAVVSHEIRTPMNGILGMVQLLHKTTLSKSQDDYVDTIHKSGDTMMALLNDILDFEKIESGNMTLEIMNFDLHRLVNDVVILMSGSASQKDIALSADIDEHGVPQVVSGDPTRLRQILLNLVNNAIKFTDEGGVSIGVRRLSSEKPNVKDKVRITIKDTGIGITEDGLDKLFTPFTQAESSTTRKYGGTGLGLAISHRLVEAMDSHIDVKSVAGQGSTFFFDLDLIVQDEQGKDKQVVDEHFVNKGKIQSVKPMNILVTEDNEMNRKVLDGLLSQQGHTLKMASNGLEALDICRNHKLDLVLMDIQLGGMDGLETTRKLRMESDPAVANIPVIALTGNVMLEDIQRFFEVGMNGFIAKPIDSNKLNETLYNASIGKFENDPKKPNEKQDAAPAQKIEPAPAPKTPHTQVPSMDPFAPSPMPQATDESEEAPPEAESPQPKNQAIFGQTPPPTEKEVATEVSAALTPDSNVDFDKIDTGLAFDNRELFVSDSELKPKAPTETDNPLVKTDVSGLTFVDEKQAQKKPGQNDEVSDAPLSSDTLSDNGEDEPTDKEEVTDIQRFLLEQKGERFPEQVEAESPPPESGAQSEPEQTPESVIPVDETPTEKVEENNASKNSYDIEDLLDLIMLEQLLGTLGAEQFLSLLEGFLSKATEIVEAIETLCDEENLATLGSRAHELKGLAGNFGMKLLSSEAGIIEKAARMSQKDEAIKTAMGLRDIDTQTQSILTSWAKDNAS